MNAYPPDEFDELATVGPAGAHRQPRSRWRALLPFLVVLIVVPLLAWAAVMLLPTKSATNTATNASSSAADAPSASASTPADQPPATSVTPAPAQTPSEIASLTATAKGDLDVAVYNVRAGNGMAGRAAKSLQELGYDKATAANKRDAQVQESVVTFSGPEGESAAAEIARKLGITKVEEDQTLAAGHKVAVYLHADYKE